MSAYAIEAPGLRGPHLRAQRPAARRRSTGRASVRMIQTPAARARRRGVIVAIILAGAALLAPQAFASDGSEPPAVLDTYTVGYGETLWSIATDLTPAGADVRDVVHDLQTLNAKADAGLMAGEQILLPVVD